MDRTTRELLLRINNSIIKIRGVYAAWARENHVNYHELLVLYSLRDYQQCTQKRICDEYLLPKQTVNNIIVSLKKKGYIVFHPSENNWREKTMELTDAGKEYASAVISSIVAVEEAAVKIMGEYKLRLMTELAFQYGQILQEGLMNPGN